MMLRALFFVVAAGMVGQIVGSSIESMWSWGSGIPLKYCFGNGIDLWFCAGRYEHPFETFLFGGMAILACWLVRSAFNVKWLGFLWVVCVATTVGIHYTVHSNVVIFNMNPHPAVWLVVPFYASLMTGFIGSGALLGIWWRIDSRDSTSFPSTFPSRQKQTPQRLDLGFTLVELLAVITIIGIVAAILFPVFGQAKRSATSTQDVDKLRQVYLATVLYEQDNSEGSPENLGLLIPRYAPAAVFWSNLDSRLGRVASDWPVNVLLNPKIDGGAALLTSQYPISFAYLNAFSGRFVGHTWTEYRNDPKAGMLVDPTLEFEKPLQFFSPPENAPADNFVKYLVNRMDGSVAVRLIPTGCGYEGGGTYQNLFLFDPYSCIPNDSGS